MKLPPLPIDALLPEVVASLRERPSLVVEAPPGAGKTTRLPRALYDAGFADKGEIVVLEPRRLATRMAARRVADELGERLGETVGYQVRFENVSGPRTRVRFVTEGLLTRKLGADPTLAGVSVVVLDEFHERHLHGDLALALLTRLQQGARPDLRLVVMSATLDAEPVARLLGAPRLRAEGRAYDVAIEHLAAPDERPVALQVASALRRLVREGLDGHVLAFLPGAAEIRRASDACAPIAREAGLDLFVLHGDMPSDEQDRVVRPSERRKVILATNVAETSVTIDGVAAVIDAGLARVAGHAAWSGLPTLHTAKVSRASATQRAGRAGRTRAGRALRLYTRGDHDTRPAFDAPEIARLDLAETMLALRAAGITDPASVAWLDPPPRAALDAAERLLSRLGAVDAAGALTPIGRAMQRLPLHPRMARLVVEGQRRGAGRAACTLAALLGERDLRARGDDRAEGSATGPSDVLALLELFEEAEAAGFDRDRLRTMGLDAGAARSVDRAQKQIARALAGLSVGDAHAASEEQALLVSILAGYPDRVARRRTVAAVHARSSAGNLALAGGGTAELARSSVVRTAPFIVAVDAEERRGAPSIVRVASAIEPEWLIDLFPDAVRDELEVRFDAATERVEASARLVYEGLVLDESAATGAASTAIEAALADAALARGAATFVEGDALGTLVARSVVAARLDPKVRALTDDDVREAVRAACAGKRSFAQLRGGSIVTALEERLGGAGLARLRELTPERVRLARGREARVTYGAGHDPFAASRLQDFFGMREGPRIGAGRVPLVVHLLAPNQRAVQITSDLAGFWERHYPAVRKELSRKYPRHAWPEDPHAPPVEGRSKGR